MSVLGFISKASETVDQLAIGIGELSHLTVEGLEMGVDYVTGHQTSQWIKDDVTGAVGKELGKIGTDFVTAVKTGDDYALGGYVFDVATLVGPASISKLKYVDEASALTKLAETSEVASTVGKVEDGEAIGIKLLKKSKASTDELVKYLEKIDTKAANNFKEKGKWPSKYQIPKDSSVLTSEGRIDWNQTPENGFVLNQSGHAIKENIIPHVGEIFDRYGLNNGRFTSPIMDGKPFTYNQRSLPYIEDMTKYHQYEVTGDFSRIKEYVDRLPDNTLKEKLYDDVLVFYGGDWNKVTTQSGRIAPAFGCSGGGIQWQLPFSIDELQKLGLIREINLLR